MSLALSAPASGDITAVIAAVLPALPPLLSVRAYILGGADGQDVLAGAR